MAEKIFPNCNNRSLCESCVHSWRCRLAQLKADFIKKNGSQDEILELNGHLQTHRPFSDSTFREIGSLDSEIRSNTGHPNDQPQVLPRNNCRKHPRRPSCDAQFRNQKHN